MEIVQDVRYVVRIIGKHFPIYGLVILALALGIGGSTVAFSVANSVLLKPLPYSDPDRLVQIEERAPRMTAVFGSDYLVWREQARSLESVAAVDTDCKTILREVADPSRLTCAKVTSTFFPTLGVATPLGRTFTAAENERGDNVAVLSHGAWRRHFGGETSVVGRTIHLDKKLYVVIGILPESFRYRRAVDVWFPLQLNAAQQARREGVALLSVVGRLAPGSGVQQAKAELNTLTQRLVAQNPSSYPEGLQVVLTPLQQAFVQNYRPAIVLLFCAVLLLHLIACVNVANLLFARNLQRRSELAIRLIVGAGSQRLVRMQLIEAGVLAAMGAVVGSIPALWSTRALVALSPLRSSTIPVVGVDLGVLGFIVLMTAVTTVLAGVLPALGHPAKNLTAVVRGDDRGSTGSVPLGRLRDVLVAGQIALTMVLVVGAGAAVGSLLRLQRVDFGFDHRNLLVVNFGLDRVTFGDEPSRIAYVREVLQRVAALPGVRGVAIHQAAMQGPLNVEAAASRQGPPSIGIYSVVTPDFFSTIGVSVERGRVLDASDEQAGANKAVVNSALARHLWGGDDPIGRRIKFGPSDSPFPWLTVVGVVRSVRLSPSHKEPERVIYVPYAATPTGSVSLFARTAADPSTLARGITAEIRSFAPGQVFDRIETMEERLWESTMPPRFNGVVLAAFAVIALCHSAVGIYGLVTWMVAQRRREIAVRMAVGARPTEVIRAIVVKYVSIAVVGAGLGVGGAISLLRVMADRLAGVTSVSALGIAGLSVFVVLLVLSASYMAARAVVQVNPTLALRR